MVFFLFFFFEFQQKVVYHTQYNRSSQFTTFFCPNLRTHAHILLENTKHEKLLHVPHDVHVYHTHTRLLNECNIAKRKKYYDVLKWIEINLMAYYSMLYTQPNNLSARYWNQQTHANNNDIFQPCSFGPSLILAHSNRSSPKPIHTAKIRVDTCERKFSFFVHFQRTLVRIKEDKIWGKNKNHRIVKCISFSRRYFWLSPLAMIRSK